MGNPKDLVLIIGPPAVGKMTVGMELSRLTGLPLFHNHMTVELVAPFFSLEDPTFGQLVDEFRQRMFEEIAAADGPGLIFTFTWNFSDPNNKERVDSWLAPFRAVAATISFAEIYAPLGARRKRNRGASRLLHKPSKRDLAASDARLLASESRQLSSKGDFPYPDRHLWIDNTNRLPEDVATLIRTRFDLPLGTTR